MQKSVWFLVFLLLGFVMIFPVIPAQEIDNSPGVTPDSFLWGFDKFLEQISLFLAVSPDAKAAKGLEIASERLAEIKVMVEKNKFESMEKASEEYHKILMKVEEDVGEINNEDSIGDLERAIEVEKKLKEHQDEIERVAGELKIKIKVKGELTDEQLALIESVLSSLDGQTGEVEVEIENKKNEIKIKISQETGRDGEEVEREIKDEKNLSGFERARAEKMFEKANKKWEDVVEKSAKFNVSIPDKSIFGEFIVAGNAALNEGKNEEAKNFYEDAKNHAEELKEEIEKLGEGSEEDELEIEVEIEEGVAEVEVEFGKDESRFSLETTDVEVIISEIIKRTGLTREQVDKAIRIEFEEESEDEEDEDSESDD